jgi:Flp pilus assembly protein TadD
MFPGKIGMLLLLGSLGACAAAAPPPAPPPAIASSSTAALVAAGDATREDGRYSEAIEIYQRALIADAGADAARLGLAECLLALQRPREAKPVFEALATDERFRPLALQGAGLSELAARNYAAAKTALAAAVAGEASLWRAWNGLARIADLERRFGEAETYYESAMKLRPDSAALYNNRGYSRLASGKANESLADFRRALVLEPDSETIQNNLRLALAALGDYAEATRNLPREHATAVLNNVGYVAMRRGDLPAAEALLARALSDNPNYDSVAATNLDRLTALKAAER